MELLDGKLVSSSIISDLKVKTALLRAAGGVVPKLAAVLVGNDGASETYVASKVKTCAEIGFESMLIRFPSEVPEQTLLQTIRDLNNDDSVHGILVQLPLPKHISEQKVVRLICAEKDVDGFNPMNTGLVVQGLPGFIPATPHGIQLLLRYYNIDTKGKHAVVIGRSNIVGRPMSILLSLSQETGNCTVTLCHSHTRDLTNICRQADIIVAALGKPGFLTKDMVKEGAVVVDVGITRIPDTTKKSGYRISGDVDFESVAPLCSYISPVPGGVGLMTIAALMMNTYKAYIQLTSDK
jgi:methylenetetrahydrofolate dehydrogenase (NADP+) / methenyltetrahydrofolate cyclohydrolase